MLSGARLNRTLLINPPFTAVNQELMRLGDSNSVSNERRLQRVSKRTYRVRTAPLQQPSLPGGAANRFPYSTPWQMRRAILSRLATRGQREA